MTPDPPATMSPPVWRRLPQVLLLALVWLLLWGSLNPQTVLGGLAVGLLVTVAFPLPVLPERMPLRPVRLLRLAGFLVWDLVVSGVQVSVVTLRDGPKAKAGVIAVPLCTRSDRVATMVAAAVALSPGSFVLQIDKHRMTWYVYALGLNDPGAVNRVRQQVMHLQALVIAALGTDEELTGCRKVQEELP
ncbi:MAG: Na+/H+ antiporter subunit E [Pseudonocardia sediminis]